MASRSTTQTVQSSFSSPCSKPQPENDVFLNFRGEDTRNHFTDHLYRALEGKRIKTFKDDTKLEPGNPISLKLSEAIEKSRIAVVILSENYASSPWCLNELVKIIECKERGLIVLPVFYHVEPKIVRHQKKTFAVAFAEHENRFQKEQVAKWRKALRDVAELSGKTLTNGPEGKFIQEIVDWIFTTLKDKSSIVYEDGFVGIDSCVEEMNSFLDMNSNDVRFIGICGKSGMGKTTLAHFVFDKIRNQFEACSFLENVKEVSKARGLETLQEQLLCDISEGALRVRDVSRGIQVIRNILCDKKVLIVVDDASEKRHLEALAGKSWFGPRSRIIVTTENEDLLKSYEIQTVYKADGLNNDEAQRLFSHKAHCEIDFLDMGNNFVAYAQGSPLVLKVLGSHLRKRTKEEWEIAWNQLKDILNEDIPEKLQIAYDGLEELEKKLFLHIACFFKGEDQNRVAAILESVCYRDDNIRKLIDKSLITIEGGKLCMHHLIQQMGWKIVCRESKDLGRHSRLWDCTDVLYVLKNNIGTDRIEGMVLNLPPNEEHEELNAEPFSKMNKLKLLKICKLHLPCLSNLSNELLLLEWHEYPLKSLPKSFQPPELVELIMHHSSIKQLPSGFSNLHKLKLIDLTDSQNLCQTPTFNGLPNIERLIFQGCTGLHTLHPSVGSLERLILLNLKDCKCLENLPNEINWKSLEILILSGCSKLKKFPKIGRNMTSMLELYLDRTAVEELPSSIKHLTGLTLLNLQDCKNLSSFPNVICSLISLEILILSGCKGQQPKASYFLGLIPTLSSIGTTLTLPYTYLTDQQPEPEPISLVLPLSFSGLSSLVSLDLSCCNLLDGALPDDLSYLSSLTSLNLRNNNFTCLPCSISQLLNLKLLFLDHCSKLQSLPYIPLSTQFVSAQGCTSLENYSNQVIVWTSGAARFTFINCHGLADDEGKIADVPLLNIHFQSLWQRYMEDQILQIKGFCLVLPQIEIPEWFKNKECGPSVRIPLPPNLFDNKSWKGIALCVIFVVPPNLIDVSPGQDSKYFHEFFCYFDMDGSLLNCPLVLKVPKETFVGSFGLWLYISHARFTEHFDEGSCISSLIRPKRLDIQIKMCGARILYEHDMLEFVQNSRQENFRSCDDLSRGHEKFIEDHMSSSQSYDLKLKQKLNLLLSTLYQVDWAKNHLYDYIFHQIARPPCWFTRTNLGPFIEMPLPADVHGNSTWLGFTICASYRIQMRAGFSYKLHSTIFLRYSSLSASDEVSFASYTTFPLSTDVFDESPPDSGRLAVFYIPRRGFQLKHCDHIGASFESSDPAVQFELCGIRLVYEQNVPEFVQTLVECILGSPDAKHQSFSVRLSDQLGMMQYCNHEKENCCPFLPERRLDPDTMRMLLPNNETIQEECTSRETFSNQVIAAGIWKNSSRGSINLGIPFGNGQYGSKMSGHLECWIKPYLQNHHKGRSDFNRCSPQSEIPKSFTKEVNGSSVRIPLHSNFYNNPSWIGFAISAVFSSHMNSTTTGSRFSHMAICHLKTNLGCMNPLLYCVIREEHVLTLLHQRIYLWESIIGHQLLSPKLSECTWVEFSFVSDSSDVSARKCAVNLVYRDNLVDFTLTMAPCITSCDDPFTSNERLPIYHRDKFSGSDGFYEDQTNGTSGQYSYGGQHPRYQLSQTSALDFNPSTLYNCCFPPSKIQDWFSHQSHGCSATLDLPSNLYHNSNWMGLVLYASFSIQGDSNFIISNLKSGKSHSLYCQCQMSMANVDAQTISFSTSKEEITWLLELGEFIWISYIPGEPFENMLQLCSRIEASFMSDCPGVIVQNCALKLLYQHNQVQFEQELKHCNNFITENRKLILKQQEDQKKRNEQYHVDEGLLRKMFSNIGFEAKRPPRLIDQPETDETEIQLGQSDLLENQEKVDKRRFASKEPTKISGEHLEKGPYDLLRKMDQEIIREESVEPGRCITANKLLCKFGEESNYTGHVEDCNLHKQKVVLKVGTMINRKSTRKANRYWQLANSLARKQRQPIEMDAKQKRNSRSKLDHRNALKNVDNDDLLSIGGHQSRSLDLPPFFHNQKSFRFEGTDSEFDRICCSLGLSGIDDFSIPIADWEAHRSNFDLATRLRHNIATSTPTPTPTPSRFKLAQLVKLDEVRVGSVTAGPSQGIKGALPPVLAPSPVAGRLVAVDHTSTWELLKSFAPLEDEVVAPNTTRLGGYDETTSSSSFSDSVSARSSSSYSASLEEEDKKQNEGPLESTSNRNENETENENKNGIGIVRATNVISVYSFSPREKLRRSISSWQKGELLGSGSFGTVYEGITEDGFFFAVKEVSLLDQGSQGKQNISYLEQEISLLKQFEHENIVHYYGTEKYESKIYIFLELVTKGSLASLYQKYHLRDSQVSAYTRQILNGLKYLHDKKVIHGDIKCSNILINASGTVKLADFGLAKSTQLIDIKYCKGTLFWMAPEVVNSSNRFYGLAADIWSLGCTVLEMLTRQHPYSHLEGMQALFMIGKGTPPLVPDSLSRDARDFILKCLQVNPNDRPTATQLLDHPFVTRPQNSFGPASPHDSIQL